LNLVAEYARLGVTFEAIGPATVGVAGEIYEVHVGWAMGNVKRLPDRVTERQMREALLQSHPDRKGLGPKLPERKM
jgi:hypothetical protein